MSTGYLTAYEHEQLDVSRIATLGALGGAEADSLEALAERLPGFCDRRHRSIKLANFCGLVRMGSRLLEILPKIDDGHPPFECRGVLLNLLRRSNMLSALSHLHAGQQLRHAPLIEAFISAFFDSVRDIVRGGLMRQYQEEQDDLRIVRGRINASRQFSIFANRQDIAACSFDELTADNSWNRFIKAGLRAVSPWVTTVALRRRWSDLIIAFDEVRDIGMLPSEFAKLTIDRKTLRCLPAAEWARRILALESPSLRAGDDSAAALLFDMNLLWEKAVATEFRRLFSGQNLLVSTQVRGRYLASVLGTGRRTVGLRPDLVISITGRSVAIGDTKWKRLKVGASGYLKPAAEDLYQMHAYAAAFECEDLLLIYPWHSGLATARETVLELPPMGGLRPRVSVVCMDTRNNELTPVHGAAILNQISGPTGHHTHHRADASRDSSSTGVPAPIDRFSGGLWVGVGKHTLRP